MKSELDPVLDGILLQARAATEPEAAQLARALAGVQQRLRAPDAAGTQPGNVQLVPAPRSGWLRRWGGLSLATGVGFMLGVQYAQREPAAHEPGRSGTAAPASPAPAPGAAIVAAPGAAPLAPPPIVEQAPVGAPGVVEPLPARAARVARDSLARAQAVPAAPKPAAQPGASSSFAEVLARLEAAQRAERDLEPERALELLDELDALADPALLREERLVARVLASCSRGDLGAARAAAARLGEGEQAAIYRRRLQESCLATAASVETGPSPEPSR